MIEIENTSRVIGAGVTKNRSSLACIFFPTPYHEKSERGKDNLATVPLIESDQNEKRGGVEILETER